MKSLSRSNLSATVVIFLTTVSLSANAQTTLESGSSSSANSGSQSQAASNPTNINAPVNHQGNLASTSQSESTSLSGSISGSSSDQQQGQNQGQSMGQSMGANNSQGQSANNAQEQSANNTQGQSANNAQEQSANNTQGQSANNSQGQEANNTQMQGQTASNNQGVNITYNTTTPRIQKVYTNNAVPLAASSSFSSDYCGGTMSGGASAAPIGISIGGAGPIFDKSCQSLRRAEKFGMAAVNAANMGQAQLAGRLMSMMIWSICTSDSGGPKASKSTAQACLAADLLGNTPSVQPPPAPAPEPAIRTPAGYPTPEAVTRQPPVATADRKAEMAQK